MKPVGYIVGVTSENFRYIGALSSMAGGKEKGVLFMEGYAGVTMFSTRDAAKRAIQKSKAFYKELGGEYDIYPVFRGEVP